MTVQGIVFTLLNGVSLGIILFILASGLSLVLGVMGILNLAHGALYMVGAFVGWSIAVQYGLNFGLAILAGGITAGLIGLAMERGFLCHLHGQLGDQVLLTIGFIYILTNLCQWVWGPVAKATFKPAFLSGSFNLMGMSYPVDRISIILIGLLIAIGLWWLQERTRVGAIIRAGIDDREMTMGLGINVGLVSSVVFFLCAFLAGVAGVIGAQLLGVNLQFGWNILVFALLVVIVGGMGSLIGSLAGGLAIGIIDSFGRGLLPHLGMTMTCIAALLILLVRPFGLFGRRI